MFAVLTATEFRNVRFFSSTRSSSFCFFEVCKTWNRILIEKKSVFCSILNTMFNFNDATAKIESLFVKILMIFWNTSSSQFSTFTKWCSFDYESIFWNFDRERNFSSRFFKIFFVVIKSFSIFEFVENANWRFFVTKNFDASDIVFFEIWISENWLFFDFSSINFSIANEMTIANFFFWICFKLWSWQWKSLKNKFFKFIKTQFRVFKISKSFVFEKIKILRNLSIFCRFLIAVCFS